MKRLLVLIGTTVGGWAGWWLGARLGVMTAFLLSIVGTGAGLYAALRVARDYFE